MFGNIPLHTMNYKGTIILFIDKGLLVFLQKVMFEQIQSPSGQEICSLAADLLTETADEKESSSTTLVAHTVDSDPIFDR